MKKLLALLTSALLVIALAVPTLATPFDYTQIGGGSTKLKKYLIVPKDTDSPAITFTYTIEPGSAETPSGTNEEGTLPVYAGVAGASVASVSFAAGDATIVGSATDEILTDTNKKRSNAKDIVITFPTSGFDKPGVYRYILTENNTNAEGVTGVTYDVDGDTARKRTIDVYVQDVNGALQVVGYVSYLGQITGAPEQDPDPSGAATDGYANGDPDGSVGVPDTEKNNIYKNEVALNTLTVKKVVAGNQGDKESTWTAKVKLEWIDSTKTDAITGVKYAKIEENGTPVQNPTYASYTSDAEVTIGHNDKLKFINVPEGVKYTVTEKEANTLGYTTTYANPTYSFVDDGTAEDKDDAVITNTRNGVIPTGVAIGFGAAAVLIGLVVVYMVVRRRSRYTYED